MTKFCPEVCEAICENIRKGHTYETACDAAGASYRSFHRWREEGEAGESDEKVAFLAAVKKADGSMITRCLDIIQDAADKGQWQAGAWMLERRHWRRYGKPADQELNERMDKLEQGAKDGKG